MDKYQEMKTFKNIYQDYCRNKADLTSLQGTLQIISVAADISIFDPGSSEATEFYIILRELMLKLESSSPLMWCSVGVLQQACRNPAARGALIHTYKFTPMLAKLLGTNIILDKKLRVLTLLEQLTYGIKISWQEAHLPALLAMLAQWVQGDEKELVRLSLGVLVNLLYKNMPAIYTLLRSIDYKQFLRTIYANQNVDNRVHASKLIIILESVSGPIPDEDILNFVQVTLTKIGSAFLSKDVFLMRHIVDFFDDVRKNDHSREVLLRYPNYSGDIERLLDVIDDGSDPECVGMMFELLNSLLMVDVPGLCHHYTKMVSIALRWTRTDLACTHSLLLVKTVATMSKGDLEANRGVMRLLDNGFEVLLLTLDAGNAPSNESRARLTALVQLLQQMCGDEVLLAKVLTMLQPDIVQQVFHPLLSVETTVGNNLFDKDSSELYIYTLSFLGTLAKINGTWLDLYTSLLRHKQVQMILAATLYSGNQLMKEMLLLMVGSKEFPTSCISLLSEALCKLGPLVMLPSGSNNINTDDDTISRQYAQDLAPLFSLSREHRLDEFIERMSEALANNQIGDVTTSAVMELYQYKLTALEHAERAMLSSLEAATNHSTSLLQQLAQLKGEVSRLHQLMHHSQQYLESMQKDKTTLTNALEKANGNLCTMKEQSILDLQQRQQILAEGELQLKTLQEAADVQKSELFAVRESFNDVTLQLAEANRERAKQEKHISDLNTFCTEAKKANVVLDERIAKRDEVIQKTEHELKKSLSNERTLKKELIEMKAIVKNQEENISKMDSQMKQTSQELQKLQRYRDAIVEMSTRGESRLT